MLVPQKTAEFHKVEEVDMRYLAKL